MPEVYVALLADVMIVLMCACLLVLFSRLAHSHPATIYLLFHIYTVTLRLFGLTLDTQTLFTKFINYGYYVPVTDSELIRASVVADVALIVMTVAWIKASVDAQRAKATSQETVFRRLSLKYIISVVLVAFPIGIVAIALFAKLPTLEDARVDLGEWQTSSWTLIIVSWSGLVLLPLIYWYGFRWWLSLSITLYLLLMAYQGFHRFRLVIPVILMMQIYLDRHRLRWPRMRIAVLLSVVALLFYPLKTIGLEAQRALSPDNRQEVSVREIVNTSIEKTRAALAGESDDQQILDEFASALTLIDENGRFYYGSTYLPLLTLPIPKQWWPDKPSIGDYIADFSRPWRPMRDMGMVVTYLGEAYANFGYFGIIIIPFLLAYGLGRAYFYAYQGHYYTVARFAYLLVACNLIQVFRDGLVALVVFTFVNMMPLAVIVLLHYFMPLMVGNKSVLGVAPESHSRNALPRQAGTRAFSTQR